MSRIGIDFVRLNKMVSLEIYCFRGASMFCTSAFRSFIVNIFMEETCILI